MKKNLTIALTGALAIGLAVPAMAETTFSGTLSINPMVLVDSVGSKLPDPNESVKPIDQRLRFTMTNKVNDFVSVVWQTEIDTPWGYKKQTPPDAPTAADKYGSAGYGGGFNTDGINLETKHLYTSIAIPETAFSMKLGLQNVSDKTTALYLNNDAAAALFSYNQDALGVTIGVAKPAPADELWAAMVSYKLSDTVGLALDLFQYDYDDGDDYTTVGLGAKVKVANIDLDAGLGFQSGDEANGMVINLGGKTKINEIAAGARLVYIADDDEGKQWKSSTETPLAGEGLYFFGFSGNANFGLGKHAMDANTAGAGLTGLIVNAGLPVDAYTIKGALGYFTANEGEDKDMGTEIAASVSRKLAEKVDVSLYASYVALGEAFGDDLDDPYAVGLKVVTPF